jgi:hypothetical protein
MEHQQTDATKAKSAEKAEPCCAQQAEAASNPNHLVMQLRRRIGNRAAGRLIQAKLKVSQPGDVYEQEADRVADQVTRMAEPSPSPPASVHSGIQAPSVQRMCAACEEQAHDQPVNEKEEITLQAKEEAGSSGEAGPQVEAQISGLRGGGETLGQSVRAFFEPRFGHDFSQVRVHTGWQAAESARTVNALAYTVGRDVVFGAGQYAPHTSEGKRLIAHELTHVVQQTTAPAGHPASSNRPRVGYASQPLVQRMSIGTGKPPVWKGFTLTVAPKDEVARVNEAIKLIRDIVNDPKGHEVCHNYFARRCPGGSAGSLISAFNWAVIWKLITSGDEYARGDAPGHNIAYTKRGYDQGAEGLAGTLIHEMMHNCGIVGESDHYLASVARLYCVGPDRNQFSIKIGPVFGGDFSPTVLYSYRRFLTAWANGHIKPMVGGDINLTGLTTLEYKLTGAEYGSAMIGLYGRRNLLWGGERFGGLTARVETGFGVGRFRLRTPGPGDPRGTSIEPGMVLQVGLGAEFYVPISTHAIPFSVEAAYRLVQPLNAEAQRIHSLVLGPGLLF